MVDLECDPTPHGLIHMALGKAIMGAKQNRMAINPGDATYKENPYAIDQHALATQFINARMAAVPHMEQNILGAQASIMGNVNRNATDASQAMAMAAAAQGQTNDAFANLAIQEAQNKANMLGNMNQASQVMINECDKVY